MIQPDEPMQTQKLISRRYYDGCRDALRRFAWWKHGTQYVGSCGYTLGEALADVDEAEREGRSYAL